MKRLIAGLRAPHYRGRQLKPGDKFEATPTDAAYFIRHGLATEHSAPKPAPAVVDTAVSPSPPSEAVEQEEPRQRRAYRRRDMTAETIHAEPVQIPE